MTKSSDNDQSAARSLSALVTMERYPVVTDDITGSIGHARLWIGTRGESFGFMTQSLKQRDGQFDIQPFGGAFIASVDPAETAATKRGLAASAKRFQRGAKQPTSSREIQVRCVSYALIPARNAYLCTFKFDLGSALAPIGFEAELRWLHGAWAVELIGSADIGSGEHRERTERRMVEAMFARIEGDARTDDELWERDEYTRIREYRASVEQASGETVEAGEGGAEGQRMNEEQNERSRTEAVL